MGLSLAYRIIKDHGGNIAVESEVGKGTRFTVSLPVLEEKS
jgi:signal transduction histidine kinase